MKILPLTSEVSIINTNYQLWYNQSDYEEDYKFIIKQREKIRIPFLHRSPEIACRKYIVQYLKIIAIDRKFSYSCLHLAVYMLDIFMDNHAILPENLKLIANACLLLSAKVEENISNIPTFQELNAAVKNRYELRHYKIAELKIFKFFNYCLMFPTPAHYVHYFMLAAFNTNEFKNTKGECRTIICNFHNYIRIYLDKIIEDVHYMQLYVPSRLAAAVISIARIQIRLNCWTPQLENLTGYSHAQLSEPVQALLGDTMSCSNCSNERINNKH